MKCFRFRFAWSVETRSKTPRKPFSHVLTCTPWNKGLRSQSSVRNKSGDFWHSKHYRLPFVHGDIHGSTEGVDPWPEFSDWFIGIDLWPIMVQRTRLYQVGLESGKPPAESLSLPAALPVFHRRNPVCLTTSVSETAGCFYPPSSAHRWSFPANRMAAGLGNHTHAARDTCVTNNSSTAFRFAFAKATLRGET
jgi:hypothetical protein